MITIVAKKEIKEGCVEAFLALARELVEASGKEEGCLEYHLYQAIGNPRSLTFIEKWADKAAIEAHNSSEHFTRIVPMFRELEAAPTEVALYKRVE